MRAERGEKGARTNPFIEELGFSVGFNPLGVGSGGDIDRNGMRECDRRQVGESTEGENSRR
jgi:hypothetical protein